MQTTTTKEKLAERLLLGTAVAALAGYIGLAWAILHKARHPTTPPIAPAARKGR